MSNPRRSLPPDLLARFDLRDPALIADPYAVLAAVRDHTPIFWYEPSQQWFLTRHALVHSTIRDRRLGRAYLQQYTDEEFGRPSPDPRWSDFYESERWSLLNLEPPDHTRLRALVSKVFTPRAVSSLRPMIEHEAQTRLDELAQRPSFDLVSEYAQPYSVAVITAMLGVPGSDADLLLGWSHAIVKMYELTTTDDQRVAANDAARDFVEYTRALVADKRRHPDQGLVAQLAQVEESGDRLTEDEVVCTTIVLLNAGHEATVNTLGNGMRAFLLHPDEWQRVVSGGVAARTAVEEMIRWDSPLQLFERWVLEDGVEIAGQPLQVGEEVAMLFGAANRDPDQFADPDRFDAGRGDATHVGFGGGIHFCVGAPLARLEVEVSVEGLRRTMPDLSLVEPPRYHDAFVIRGLTALHLAPRAP